MIVLDANVLIAFLDGDDAHHSAAIDLLDEMAGSDWATNALNLAEALVYPSLKGTEARERAAIAAIGVGVLPLRDEDVLAVAAIRAGHRLRMPDAVALHTALSTSSTLATFDAGLTAAAREVGVPTLP